MSRRERLQERNGHPNACCVRRIAVEQLKHDINSFRMRKTRMKNTDASNYEYTPYSIRNKKFRTCSNPE